MDDMLEKLESLLLELLQEHEMLLALIKRKRHATKHADQQQVAECCQLENMQIQTLGELEKARLKLIAKLTLAVDPTATQPLQMADLANALEEPWRTRLSNLRQQIRKRMTQTRQEVAVTQKATESLVKHMQGLMQTVTSAYNGVATYSSRGQLPRQVMNISTFNATA